MRYSYKAKEKLNEYFLTRLGMYVYNKGWLKGTCPSCGKKDKFGVHLATNKTNCFVCGYNDPPIQVIMDQENIQTDSELYSFLGTFEGIAFLDSYQKISDSKAPIMALPEGYKLILIGKSRIGELARSNLKGRGFNLLDLARAGVGYCTSGFYAYHLIFPFFEKGKLIYFNARNMLAAGPKFNNPSTEEYGIGKNFLLYNVDALALYKKIYLVESATNALTIGPNAIALGGKTLSDYQLNKILCSPVEYVVIILDLDAWPWAIEVAMKLYPYKKIKLVKMESDEDINDIGRRETLRLVKQFEYLEFQDIIALKNSL